MSKMMGKKIFTILRCKIVFMLSLKSRVYDQEMPPSEITAHRKCVGTILSLLIPLKLHTL